MQIQNLYWMPYINTGSIFLNFYPSNESVEIHLKTARNFIWNHLSCLVEINSFNTFSVEVFFFSVEKQKESNCNRTNSTRCALQMHSLHFFGVFSMVFFSYIFCMFLQFFFLVSSFGCTVAYESSEVVMCCWFLFGNPSGFFFGSRDESVV